VIARQSYFISFMHFLTKAARCSMGTFSRIALSSHARIFLESARDSIRSGAVDFMLVASTGGVSQGKQSARPTITINVRRMAAPNRGPMMARLLWLAQGPTSAIARHH
jgi:hypothetical protein